jgi:hypothetical protein
LSADQDVIVFGAVDDVGRIGAGLIDYACKVQSEDDIGVFLAVGVEEFTRPADDEVVRQDPMMASTSRGCLTARS